MKTKLWVNLILFTAAVAVGFAVGEVVSRIITTTDADGQVYLKKKPLLPYHFPAEMVKHKLNQYFKEEDQAYVVDDPELGWTIAPNHTSRNGLYISNSRGIRSAPYEYTSKPTPGVLRIALFGDSFTHGDEVTFFKTWGYFLEKNLIEDGVSAEVINFGVGGYGIGQAYLRWNRLGITFRPDIAVFGFQAENMQRAVNIIRSLYSRNTWLVFSKPRLILDDEGKIQVVNSPVIPPEEVPGVLENFQDSPLAKYEFWYNPHNYRNPFWLKSRFLQIIYNKFRRARPDFKDYSTMEKTGGGTPEAVSLAILRLFAREVKETGAIPIILHIPKKSHTKLLWKGLVPAYYELFDHLKAEGIKVVNPGEEMMDQHRLYLRSHFSRKGGQIVARVLADTILEILAEENRLSSYTGTPPNYAVIKSTKKLLEEYRDGREVFIDLGTTRDLNFIKRGFHSREKHLNRIPIRWTKETAVLLLPFVPQKGKKPVLSFRIIDTGPERDWAEACVSVVLNGDKIGQIPLHQGGDTYRLELSANIKEPGLAAITITSPGWQPNRLLGAKDPRLLGVMLDWVKLTYE